MLVLGNESRFLVQNSAMGPNNEKASPSKTKVQNTVKPVLLWICTLCPYSLLLWKPFCASLFSLCFSSSSSFSLYSLHKATCALYLLLQHSPKIPGQGWVFYFFFLFVCFLFLNNRNYSGTKYTDSIVFQMDSL